MLELLVHETSRFEILRFTIDLNQVPGSTTMVSSPRRTHLLAQQCLAFALAGCTQVISLMLLGKRTPSEVRR